MKNSCEVMQHWVYAVCNMQNQIELINLTVSICSKPEAALSILGVCQQKYVIQSLDSSYS